MIRKVWCGECVDGEWSEKKDGHLTLARPFTDKTLNDGTFLSEEDQLYTLMTAHYKNCHPNAEALNYRPENA